MAAHLFNCGYEVLVALPIFFDVAEKLGPRNSLHPETSRTGEDCVTL